MEIISDFKGFKNFCNEKGIRLIYFSTNTCCVCSILKPKIEDLIKKYSIAKIIEIKASESIDIASQLNIFMFPAIILYIDGKEVLREAKYISILKLEEIIDRYFKLYN